MGRPERAGACQESGVACHTLLGSPDLPDSLACSVGSRLAPAGRVPCGDQRALNVNRSARLHKETTFRQELAWIASHHLRIGWSEEQTMRIVLWDTHWGGVFK